MDPVAVTSFRMQRHAADDPLWRADHEELVVDGLVGRRFAEEIPDSEEHLPLRVAEVHERQRLPDLHVEARVERGPTAITALGRLRERRC